MNTSIFRRLAALALTLAFALGFCACSDLADAAFSEAADAVLSQAQSALDEADAAQSGTDAVSAAASNADNQEESGLKEQALAEDGWYYSRDDVALYLHTYNHLPTNYLTKNEAEALGWNNKEGNLWDVADGYCIGGNKFGNYEGRLPEKSGRTWHECDVNYQGGYRGSDRLLYSTDGLIYYTEDHYNTFTQLY